jgi:DNA-binding Lrp family transcriptional regulator
VIAEPKWGIMSRRPRHSPGSLAAPLDEILGTRANVRVIRVLANAQEPLGTGEIAQRSTLDRVGVWRAVSALEESGILTRVGAGPSQLVALSSTHPLAIAILELFSAERMREQRVRMGLRHVAATLQPPPRAVWIDPRPSGRDVPSQTLVVRVFDSSATIGRAAEALRGAAAAISAAEAVVIEVRGVTAPDLAFASAEERRTIENAEPILGIHPRHVLASTDDSVAGERQGVTKQGVDSRNILSHADHDARARSLAAAIAAKLARNPSLIAHARDQVAQRLKVASAGERQELEEWDRILNSMSPASLRRFLVDDGERATRLRQTSPFAGLLTEEERGSALAKFVDPPREGR